LAARAAGTALTTLLLASSLALATSAAQAAPARSAATKLTNKLAPGFQSAIGCLTSKLCVITGYNSFSTGDLVLVKSGTPGKATAVHGTEHVQAISCPNSSGCVALAESSSAVKVDFLTIGKSGKVTASKSVSPPSGDSLSYISCNRVTSCEVAGVNVFASPIAIVVGTWNGKKLSVHQVAGIKGSTDTVVAGLACYGGHCEVVGSSSGNDGFQGISLAVAGTKTGQLRTNKVVTYDGVACTSKSLCYAVGDYTHGGKVVTIKNGAAGATSSTPSDLTGIACSGARCTAIGEELPPPTSVDPFYGTVLSVSSGKITGLQAVTLSQGFSGVGRVGTFFEAVGASQVETKEPSEVTSG
jgi:hypothetical protein